MRWPDVVSCGPCRTIASGKRRAAAIATLEKA